MAENNTDKGSATSKNQTVLEKLLKGTSITFGGIIVGTVAQFLIRAILARSLGADGYGQLMLGLSILYVVSSFCTLALDIGIARFIPHYVEKKDYARLKGSIISSVNFCFFISLAAGVILYMVSGYLASDFFNDASLTGVIKVFALVLPFFAIETIFVGGLRGFERMDYLTYTDQLAKQAGLVLVALSAYWIGFSVLEVSIGYAAVFFFMFILGIYYLKKTIDGYQFWAETERGPMLKKLLGFSWPLIFSQQLSESRKRADTLFLGYFSTSAVVGAFNVAMPIARLLQLIISAVNKTLMPAASKLYFSNDYATIKNVYQTTSFWTFFLTLPIYLVIIFNASFLIEFIFGPEYTSAALALIILATGFFINSATGSFGEMLIAMDKPKINLTISLIALVTNIVLNIILIPRMGLEGAAVAACLSLISATIYGAGYLYLHSKLQPFRRNHFVVFLTYTTFLYMASYYMPFDSTFMKLLALIVVSAGVMMLNYKILQVFGLFNDEEEMIIEKMWNEVKIK